MYFFPGTYEFGGCNNTPTPAQLQTKSQHRGWSVGMKLCTSCWHLMTVGRANLLERCEARRWTHSRQALLPRVAMQRKSGLKVRKENKTESWRQCGENGKGTVGKGYTWPKYAAWNSQRINTNIILKRYSLSLYLKLEVCQKQKFRPRLHSSIFLLL